MNTTLAPPPPRAIRSQDDFFSLVERNVDGILVIDPLGHILYANRSAARMLGRSAEELARAMGLVFDGAWPPDAPRDATPEEGSPGASQATFDQ